MRMHEALSRISSYIRFCLVLLYAYISTLLLHHCSMCRVITGATNAMLLLFLVHLTIVTAVETKLLSWSWMMGSSTLCEFVVFLLPWLIMFSFLTVSNLTQHQGGVNHWSLGGYQITSCSRSELHILLCRLTLFRKMYSSYTCTWHCTSRLMEQFLWESIIMQHYYMVSAEARRYYIICAVNEFHPAVMHVNIVKVYLHLIEVTNIVGTPSKFCHTQWRPQSCVLAYCIGGFLCCRKAQVTVPKYGLVLPNIISESYLNTWHCKWHRLKMD